MDAEDSDSFSDSSSEKGAGLERNSRSSAEARSSGAEARKQRKRRAREGRKTQGLLRGVVGMFRECEILSDCILYEDGISQCRRKKQKSSLRRRGPVLSARKKLLVAQLPDIRVVSVRLDRVRPGGVHRSGATHI